MTSLQHSIEHDDESPSSHDPRIIMDWTEESVEGLSNGKTSRLAKRAMHCLDAWKTANFNAVETINRVETGDIEQLALILRK